MAKGSFATGTMSGKLGIYVFMRRKGEQVSRAWVKPNNAQTRAQGVQRSSLSNIIRLYQSSPSFFKSAFENKASNQSDYNALVKRNLGKAPRVVIPKDMSDAGGGVVAPYVISDGTLQPIVMTGLGVTARTNIAIGDDFVLDDTTTVGALSAAILANNTFLQEGDQLSYLSIEQYTYGGYPHLRSRKYELRINSASSELVRGYMPEFALSNSGGYIGHGAYVYSGAFAYVYSRIDNSGLHVSRQSLIVTSDNLYTGYTGSTAETAATRSYGNDKSIFLDPLSQEGGVSSIPSASPQVASMLIKGNVISSGVTSPLALIPLAALAPDEIAISGSALGLLTNAYISMTGKNASNVDMTIPKTVVPFTVESDTFAVNSSDFALNGMRVIETITLFAGDEVLYSFTAAGVGGGSEDPGV